MRRLFGCVTLLILGIVALSGDASAARLPDKVARAFVIEGASALKVAEALGLPTDHDNHLSLPWKRDSSQCYRGVDADGKAEYGPCDSNPAPVNLITLTVSVEVPKLEISGIWFDGQTGSLPDMPRYSFTSPLLKSGEDLMGWAQVGERVEPQLAHAKDGALRFLNDDRPLIEIRKLESDGDIQISIAIDDRPPAARMIAEREYQGCLERLKERGDDGGC